jgi:hypothetical protein
MTLLEVMLALTLTAFVLVSISMAIDLHLRMLDSRRGDVERVQVARAVLKLIANDLRAAVQPSPIDFSSLAAMAIESAGGGDLAALAEAAGGDAGAAAGGGSDAGGADMMGLDDAGVDLSGLGDATESASLDIATAETSPSVPGLYGNQFELQVDVSRLPRVDEMQRMVAAMGELIDIPSDVKTVAYYYHDPNNSLSSGDFRDAAGNPQSGLVRRVLDRAVTLYASDNASMTSVQNVGEIIAPEIAGIQFEYFDGYQWLVEWDSNEMGGLPPAVRITVMMWPSGAAANGISPTVATPTASDSAASGLATGDMVETYSLTVRLPTATPVEETTTDESGMEAVGL